MASQSNMPTPVSVRNVDVIRSIDFVDRIGVNTHIPYTDSGYTNVRFIISSMDYLGIHQIRDGISDGDKGSAPLSSYISVAKGNNKFTFIAAGGESNTDAVQNTFDLIDRFLSAVPGSVRAIEGPNEINNQSNFSFNGVGGIQGAVALQKFLFATVNAMSSFAGVSVNYFTGYNAGKIPVGPDPHIESGLANYDNQHPYPNGGQPPAKWVDPSKVLGNETTLGPFVYTETGYSSNNQVSGGVNSLVQEKYTLDLLLDCAKFGSSGTYLYQLLDGYKPGSPQGDDGFGLFDNNYRPKLAAMGIHNLTTILADNGNTASTFTPETLDFSVSDSYFSANSLTIAKSDGVTDIAVWAEPEIWDEVTKTEITAPIQHATINFGGSHKIIIYDPIYGVIPIHSYDSTKSVTVEITDHPIIIEVHPIGK